MSPDEKKPELYSILSKLLASFPYRIEGQWFYNQRIILDGYTFVRCRFDSCDILTSKGTFVIDHCFFSTCRFTFQDEAWKIVRLYNITATEARTYWPILAPTINEDGTLSIN